MTTSTISTNPQEHAYDGATNPSTGSTTTAHHRHRHSEVTPLVKVAKPVDPSPSSAELKKKKLSWHHDHHLSMSEEDYDYDNTTSYSTTKRMMNNLFKRFSGRLSGGGGGGGKHNLLYLQCLSATIVLGFIAMVLLVALSTRSNNNMSTTSNIVSVEDAREYMLDIGNGPYQIWFRTWGRMDGKGGIPVLFVHGGPGNAIEDYYNEGNNNNNEGNKRFFSADKFLVVEIDQRGTGKSQPSVRDDWHNMKYYTNISIDTICHDFELVRRFLQIDRWLVWGGSFGSTLAIHYGQQYPQSCLALIIRGIYLDTAEEVHAVYARETYLNNPKRLHEFDILFQYAKDYYYLQSHKTMINNNMTSSSKRQEEDDDQQPLQPPPLLDPNDAEQLLRIYAEMIAIKGDQYAIWHWFVFENNLMEIEPDKLLDPNVIDPQSLFPEAMSVSFFETHLWLHGSYDNKPNTTNLLGEDQLDQLTMPIWICQGQRDEVCPPQYARKFAAALESTKKSPSVVSRFLNNATHEDTDPIIEDCLKWSLKEFVSQQEFKTHS